MPKTHSGDPRAARTRAALQSSFKELLKHKPYQKITISDIADKAGIARHTFYNHYETKQDLLYYVVDSILEEYYGNLENLNLFGTNPEEERRMHTSFFQAWKDNADVIGLLKSVDLDMVIIERLKTLFRRFYYEKVADELPGVSLQFANYVISFNAYTLVGLLKPWFDSGMKDSPSDLGGFLVQLSGSSRRFQAVEKYRQVLTG